MGDPKLSSDHKVTLPIYSGSNPDSWLKKYNLACEINNLNEQDKLARVPFYLPDAIGDWVLERNFKSWKDFVESFESRYHPTTSKVEMLAALISINQNVGETPLQYLTRWESLVSSYQRKNEHGVPELVLVQSFVSGLSNATLKQLTIDKLNATSTVDKMVKVFSLLITHHCGISATTSTTSEPINKSMDMKFDSMMQGMNKMFEQMDTFLAQASSNSSGPSTTPSSANPSSGSFKKCFNCKASDHQTKTCPLPCKYCKSSTHKHYECKDPKAVAARQYRAAANQPGKSDSMFIDVLVADKRSHSVDDSSSDKRTKRTDTRTVIRVEDLIPAPRAKTSRAKIPSQVSSDKSLDVASLVNQPVYNLSLAQIATHPSWRSQIKDALTKRYIKKGDVALTTKPTGNCAPWTLGTINDISTPLILDGGSSVDIISLNLVKTLGINELQSSNAVINVANGSSAYPVGEVGSLKVSLGNHNAVFTNVLVFENLPYDFLVGRSSLHLLGVKTDWAEHIWTIDDSMLDVKYNRAPTVPRIDISLESEFESDDDSVDGYLICLADVSPPTTVADPKQVDSFVTKASSSSSSSRLGDLLDQVSANPLLNEQQRLDLESLVLKNESVFGTSYEHLSQTNLLKLEINTGDATPIYRKPHLNLSYNERDYLKKELEDMVSNGIIVPSTYGPNSGWSFPVRFVPKKGGQKRLVTQFMALNAVTVRDPFPLPPINDLLDQLSGATWLSALDLLKGFHQIGVQDNSVDKLTITTPFGNFSYTVMPFGIVNGPSVFSRMISMALAPLHSCALAYIDDITVFSSSFDQHMDDLASVFARMKDCNLVLNPNKCHLMTNQLELLGFTVNVEKGILPQRDRLSCLDSFPTPRTVTDVKAYLGFVGYFRRHIPCFADVAHPLSSLLSKSVPFAWTSSQQLALTSLNKLLKESVPLCIPNPTMAFELYTDASDVAIGAALIQDSRPVAFLSRKLKQAELNYAIVEKEILAVVYAFSKFRKYLIDRHFNLYTDNNAVRYILNKSEPSARLQRWTLALQEFSFSVHHISGKSNVVADVLSRYPPATSANISGAEESLYHGLLVMPSLYESDLQAIFDHLLMGVNMVDLKLKRRASSFAVINHRLHKRIGQRLVFVPPLDERDAVIEHIHDGHGHFGVQSTWSRLYLNYWWPSSYSDVKKHLGACIPCAIFSPVAKQRSLGHVPISGLFHRFSIDYIGPFPTSSNGNKYILLAVESFTRYPIAIATPTNDALTAATFLYVHIFSHFGPPLELLSDNGSHFLAAVVRRFLELISTYHKLASPYHPQCNGQVERINGVISSGLKKLAHDNPDDWDSYLPGILYAYRTKAHSYLNISPFELLYGQTSNSPDSNILDLLGKLNGWERLVFSGVSRDAAWLKELERSIGAPSTIPTSLTVGAKVLLSIPSNRSSNKFSGNYYKDPYTVVACFDNNTFLLVDSDGKPMKRRINGTRLKLLA